MTKIIFVCGTTAFELSDDVCYVENGDMIFNSKLLILMPKLLPTLASYMMSASSGKGYQLSRLNCKLENLTVKVEN